MAGRLFGGPQEEMIRLVSVYGERLAIMFLYKVLEERLEEPAVNISHRGMPTFEEHARFVRSHTYRAWYLIEAQAQEPLQGLVREIQFSPVWVGSIYLTTKREVGIHVLRQHRGRGYGRAAMANLRKIWPGPLLANINPANELSIKFFAGFGARHIQNTYEIP